MIIKERVYKKCDKCGRNEFVSGEEYGCDNCKKPITLHSFPRDYLQATVFKNPGGESEHFEFCSWKCAFAKLRKIKSNYFINLPYLSFDVKKKGMTVKDFWECLKK